MKIHGALAVLAAPRRFDLLVLMLSGKERSVSQMAEAVGLSQSCTTRHLQALARAGLVKRARDGKRVVFRIAPRDAAARTVLSSVTGGRAGTAFERDGERSETPRRRPLRPGRPARGLERAAERTIVDDVPRIDSAAEFEPLMAAEQRAGPDLGEVERPEPESGRTSEPEAPPAWRRSDLEDFLL